MIDEIRTRMVRRYGATAEAWVATLPDLVAAVAARWHLVVGTPYNDGNSGVTLRVTTDAGSPAVGEGQSRHGVPAGAGRVAADVRAERPGTRGPGSF